MSSSPTRTHAIVALGALSLLAAFSLWRLTPPADVDPGSEFDSARAMAHLRFIASAPRQIGSEHHRATREYLVREFESLGLETHVQDAVVPNPGLHGLQMRTRNVVARLPGRRPGAKAVALAAHYDTTRVAPAPGEGDDGDAVAALLDVARILASDPPDNDVIFLITDGEEVGLLGARAFVYEHPWRYDVGVILNFEARGTRGPSIMFETSPQNRWLVEEYALASPHPVTSSLSVAIYALMPNKTDFTIFRKESLSGLNFAFIGGYANYHKPTDDLDHLDLQSMRHHGVQALALARRFGSLDLMAERTDGAAVYFNVVPGGWVVRFPACYAVPLALLGALLLGSSLVIARRRFSLGGVSLSMGIMLGSIVLTGAVVWLLLRGIQPPLRDRFAEVWIALFCVLAIGVVCLSLRFCSDVESLVVALMIWTILSVTSSLLIPSASYIFTLPAAGGTIGLLAWVWPYRFSGIRITMFTLAAAPTILLLVPTMYLAFLALRVRSAWITIAVVVLALWLLAPLLRCATKPHHSAVSDGGGA